MKPASYWNKRMEILEQSRYDGNVQSYHEIERIYRKQMAEMQKEINAWYGRFAKNNEISLADARKLLDAKELDELKWNVEDYIKYGEENALDPKWIKQLENASARYHISRLEALQLQIQQRAEAVMSGELDVIDARVREVYQENYYHTAFEFQRGVGIGWDLERLDDRRIDNVIKKPWAVDGKNFSERIWEQRDKLVNTLHQELTQSIIRGEDPERAVQALADRMHVSQSNARRLIMTESAAMASAAQKDCYNELDVEKYKIVATLDDLTCDVCAGLDGQVFKMSEYNVGTTAPPFHPNCRTVTVPYFADDTDSKRAARGADGKTYLVPADTKYTEWKAAFVDGGEKPFEVQPEPEPIELKYTFIEAKTIEEAQEYAKQFIGDGYAPHFKNNVNFKGISIEHANEINRALTDAFNRFDLPKLNGITTVSPTSAIGKKAFKDGADAVFSYSPAEGGIYINKDIVKNAKSFETYVKRSEDAWNAVMNNIDKLKGADKEKALIYQKAGRDLVDGKSIKGLFTHEIGHHVQWQLLKPKEINDIGSRKSQFAPNISGYANATQGEYIAESFAAYMKGERSKLDPEFVKLLDGKTLQPVKPKELTLGEKIGSIKTEYNEKYRNHENVINELDKEIQDITQKISDKKDLTNREMQKVRDLQDEISRYKSMSALSLKDKIEDAQSKLNTINPELERYRNINDKFYNRPERKINADAWRKWRDWKNSLEENDPNWFDKLINLETQQAQVERELKKAKDDKRWYDSFDIQKKQKEFMDANQQIMNIRKEVNKLNALNAQKQNERKNAGVLFAKEVEPLIQKSGKIVFDEINKFDKFAEDAKKIEDLTTKNVSYSEKYNQAKTDEERKKIHAEWVKIYEELKRVEDESYINNAKEVQKLMKDVRNWGSNGADINGHLNNGKSKSLQHVVDAYELYPKEWVDASLKRGNLTVKTINRGNYDDVNQIINISGDGGDAYKTAVHELGHRMEKAFPILADIEQAFYDRRTQGEQLVPLRNFSKSYDRDEMTRKDNFIDPYMGKDYSDKSFELISMGFENAFCNPHYLKKDPEFAQWIFGILTLV